MCEDKVFGMFRQGYTMEEVEKMLAQNRAGNAVPPNVNGPR